MRALCPSCSDGVLGEHVALLCANTRHGNHGLRIRQPFAARAARAAGFDASSGLSHEAACNSRACTSGTLGRRGSPPREPGGAMPKPVASDIGAQQGSPRIMEVSCARHDGHLL